MQEEDALKQLTEKAKQCLQEGTSLEELDYKLAREEAACMAHGFSHRALRLAIESAIDEVQIAT